MKRYQRWRRKMIVGFLYTRVGTKCLPSWGELQALSKSVPLVRVVTAGVKIVFK